MPLKPDPLWYKDALIYEVHVRAFYDSVTDGIGDFGGLTQKLDYLEDLGVTAIWLLPFCPSPLRDDGYDISSYTDVHPSYGNLKEVQRFLREAHRRGLRVITELVLNHTSDQHVWFQRSRRAAPGTRWRNFYVWSDTPDRYRDARIIFKDFETSNWTWDPVAKAYYWHRFYSHQPDLNWDNPEVKEAMFAALDFWFDMGVDGLRLDAVPYLFEREGSNCENLPETHQALRELRSHVASKYRDRMLLAEANQWPEESVAYFGQGDECHMAFHFPVMPRMFMSLRMEDRYPMTDILRLTPAIPANCQWAMFLRNHDELTLEMVTDEERDYMYRTYAHDRQMRINLGIRRRLAPLLENDRRKIELMNALLFSMPGTPVVYYGDEIGMGDNVYLGDRNGVRTPMQWSADRNAGFSRANPQKLYLPVNIDPEYHYEAINVETQQNNPHSLLWWMKRLIAQRKQFRAFGRGSLEFLYPTNRKVLAFVRQYEDESILVIANLSRFAQSAELDLCKFEGHVPVEVFGRSSFPPITSNPYLLSLGPHAFYWFHLQPSEATQEGTGITAGGQAVPVIEVEDLEEVFEHRGLREISRLLPRLLRARAWFLGKRNTIRSAKISYTVPITGTSARLTFVDVEYSDSDPETYLIPLSVAAGERADAILRERGESVVARLRRAGSDDAVLYGAIYDRDFSDAMLRAILKRSKYKGGPGEVVASHTREFREAWSKIRAGLEPHPRSGRLNTTINFGENFVLKLYRKIEPGMQPDREIAEFLTQNEFTHTPRALGALEYRMVDADGELQTTSIGLLTSFPRNATLGWDYMLHQLGLYFERALTLPEGDPQSREFPGGDPLSLIAQPVPAAMLDWLGTNVELIRQLGIRAAEMHTVLASRRDLPDFAPEPFTDFYRHGLYHGMVGQINRSLDALRARLNTLNAATRDEARALISREADIRATLQPLRDFRIGGSRIRHHGDFHLGHVLFTGNDAVITEFGGDPARPMSERRIKRTALRDIASMLRSFHYMSHAVLYGQVPGIDATRKDHPLLEKWAQAWYQWASAIFLSAYMQTNKGAEFLPQTMDEVRTLLSACLIEKAMVEISYELENRPDWVRIPVHGVLEQLQRVETEVGR
ncbi:MAG TPA: maltose alpha-D-glucosyltransferase [Clostridia bacterium]|nr:maltose alpha-D-glucosyltransferase [Clostridia bacterium]